MALSLQFYREDIADDELYARPAPIDMLAEAVRGLVTRIGQRMTMWIRGPQRPVDGDAEQLAPRWHDGS